MSKREKEIRTKLRDDFPHYASKCLRIRTKTGGIETFVLNQAQRYIHEKLEKQRKEQGFVRAVILKGRQQGCSTLIEGRYFWLTSHRHGCRAMILTHMQDATDNLFGMVDRYYENCPELVRPVKGKSNTKELHFSELESSYRASTAGSRGAGRSETVQLFHGSEVGFWPNADEHLAGALQAVPLAENTEVILESTANGIGNAFHRIWQDAESGRGDFVAIFVPWFWQDEYRRPPPADFELSDEEQEYRSAHGLDMQQMAWRRAKIVELRGDEVKFRQEYPATAAEAFEQSDALSLIKPKHVMKARKATIEVRSNEPLVIGVDLGGVTDQNEMDEGISRPRSDKTAIVRRQGRAMLPSEVVWDVPAMALVGLLGKIIDSERPKLMAIDLGNGGHIVVDRLIELGYRSVVKGVDFGGAASRPEVYANKRAEMWDDMRQWFEEEGGADMPDDDEFHADIVSVQRKLTSVHTKLVLESKVDMARRGVRSPDIGDAAALTFAFPVSAGFSGPLPQKDLRSVMGRR